MSDSEIITQNVTPKAKVSYKWEINSWLSEDIPKIILLFSFKQCWEAENCHEIKEWSRKVS